MNHGVVAAPGVPRIVAIGVALLAACGEAGPEIGSGPPARLEVVGGQVVTGLVGNVVATPGFRVRSQDGGVLPGVTVRFRLDGSGALARAEAVSGPDGVASPGGWRLGSEPGAQRLIAESGGLSVSHAVEASMPPAPGFQIEILYEGRVAPTPSDRQVIEAAARRWEELVIGDLPDVRIRETPSQCPMLLVFQNRLVDDLLLFVSIGPVAPGIIANTDVCIRRGSGLPAVARITVDPSVAAATSGLSRAMEHEIAHALGVGTAWPAGLLRERDGDLRFVGRSAEAAFHLALGPSAGRAGAGVPVEMGGGSAVARSHWRESILDRELLTPFSEAVSSSPVEQPLSAITVSSLRDIGHVVDDRKADPFPDASPGREHGGASGLRRSRTGPADR